MHRKRELSLKEVMHASGWVGGSKHLTACERKTRVCMQAVQTSVAGM